MNRLNTCLFIFIVFAGFTASFVYQYQTVTRTVIVAEEQNETSGETDSSLSNIFNEEKYLTDSHELLLKLTDSFGCEMHDAYSIPSGLLAVYDHYSPPEA
jgi:hypothetical protein